MNFRVAGSSPHNFHMKNICIILIAALACMLLSSCIALIGGSNPERKAVSEIQSIAKKWGIPSEHSYFIDSLYLKKEIEAARSVDRGAVKDMYQPLQIRQYDRDGKLVGFMANCHAGGFPNLHWNKYGYLDIIPIRNRLDSVLTFAEDIRNFNVPGQQLEVDENKYIDNDYNLVVFWTVWTGRQTRILLKEIEQYKARFPDKRIGVLYVNAESLYYEK